VNILPNIKYLGINVSIKLTLFLSHLSNYDKKQINNYKVMFLPPCLGERPNKTVNDYMHLKFDYTILSGPNKQLN